MDIPYEVAHKLYDALVTVNNAHRADMSEELCGQVDAAFAEFEESPAAREYVGS